MDNSLLQAVATTAAKYWTNQLRHLGPNSFKSDGSTISKITKEYTLVILKHSRPSEDKLRDFESLLVHKIYLELQSVDSLTLYVKYRPCSFLSEIANRVGISTSIFPWDTKMHISSQGTITVTNMSGLAITIFPE